MTALPVAVVTGASRGIGAACAAAFAAEGYAVAVNYLRSAEKARAVVAEIVKNGGEAFAVAADVGSDVGAGLLVETVREHYGRVDVLVNNAGIDLAALVTETSEDDYRRVTDVNFGGAFRCTKYASRLMVARHSGAIVNISSVWGANGGSGETVYSAAKAALIGFTKACAKELGPSGITVNCVAPGVIDTDMNAAYSKAEMDELAAQTPLGRIGMPAEVAAAVVALAKNPFVTGQVLGVDGGFE